MKAGFLIGAAASVIAGGAMLLARLVLGIPSPPEALIDLVTAVLPVAVFSYLLEALGGWAKPLLVAGLASFQILAGGAVGVLWLWGDSRFLRSRQRDLRRGRWAYTLALAALLWGLAMVTLLPAAGKGVFGGRSGLALPVSWLAYSLVYGVSLAGLSSRWGLPRPQAEAKSLPADATRRYLVQKLALVAVGALLAAGLGRYVWLAVARAGQRARQRRAGMPLEITPNEDFYVVYKDLVDTKVDSASWKLTVDGLVERPLALTYEQLQALPSATQFLTLECISNEVGEDLIDNAQWKGVPLRQLLAEAGVQGSVRKVVLHAADGYSDSVTLEKALEPGTIIAYEMNGAPLSSAHGYPARLLVPGIYGMKNVKWLTRIELVDYDYRGYWQQRGWSDQAVIMTMSRIDVPQEYGSYHPGDIAFLGGVAFAGDRGIAQVEVSTDGGKTWSPSRMKEALSAYTWVLWTKDWTPPGLGSYTLLVRATDGTGALQPSAPHDPLPDGATGYHTIVVRILEETSTKETR